MKQTQLTLQQEILLLALKDEEGTIASGTMYEYAASGAIMAELLLTNRIEVDASSRKKKVHVLSTALTGDTILDECLQIIQDSSREKNLESWVMKFAQIKNLKHRIAGQLVEKGILRKDEDKVLLVFSRKIYPEVNPEPEKQIIQRLHNAIFTQDDNVSARTVVLLSLAKSASLLKIIFNKKDLREHKKRIASVIEGEATGKAAQEAIEAVQAAIMVAAIMPAIISTTVTTTVSS